MTHGTDRRAGHNLVIVMPEEKRFRYIVVHKVRFIIHYSLACRFVAARWHIKVSNQEGYMCRIQAKAAWSAPPEVPFAMFTYPGAVSERLWARRAARRPRGSGART